MLYLSRWIIPLLLSAGIHLSLWMLFFIFKPIHQPLELKSVQEFIITSVVSLPVIVEPSIQKSIEEPFKEESVVVPPKEEVKVKRSVVPKKVDLKALPQEETNTMLAHANKEISPSAPLISTEVQEEVIKPSLVHQSNVDSEEIQRYLVQVKQKVQGHLEYPAQAKKMRLEGETILKFSIFTNGSLNENSIEIVQSSGKKIFDEQAIVALKEASPYPSPPKESIVLSVPVSFKLKS